MLYGDIMFAAMEFYQMFLGYYWCFAPQAPFNQHAKARLAPDAARILARIRARRVRSGYRPDRQAFLHRACCDFTDLVDEVKRWQVRWPIALAALRVAAEGAWLHPMVSEFTYVPELPKFSCATFVFEQTRGEGMGRLARFQDDGEWMPVAEAMELLAEVEAEASVMVDTLLAGLLESLED